MPAGTAGPIARARDAAPSASLQQSRGRILQPVAPVGRSNLVEIKTVAGAVRLLDEWIAEARFRLREIERLHEEIFWANHKASVHFFTCELLRWQLRDAGITPADEVTKS